MNLDPLKKINEANGDEYYWVGKLGEVHKTFWKVLEKSRSTCIVIFIKTMGSDSQIV